MIIIRDVHLNHIYSKIVTSFCMNVSIIGTGMMGSKIALRLAQKGHGVTVFNRDRSKSEKLRKSGLTVADQPSELEHYCDVALICVLTTNFRNAYSAM